MIERTSAAVTALLTGLLVGYVLNIALPDDSSKILLESGWHVTYFGFHAGGCVALLVAALTAVLLGRTTSLVAVLMTAGAGLALIAVMAAAEFGLAEVYLNGLGCGLVLGGVVALLRGEHHRLLLVALITAGIVFIYLFGDNLRRTLNSRPRRYADYVPDEPSISWGIVAAAVLVAGAIGCVIATRVEQPHPAPDSAPGRTIGAGALLTAAGLATLFALTQLGWTIELWRITVGVTVVVVLFAAWLLPGRTGCAVLASTAIAAASVCAQRWEMAAGALVLAAVLTAVGIAIGTKWPQPAFATLLLAVVPIATSFSGHPDWSSVSVLWLGPAAGFALASSVRTIDAPAAMSWPVVFALPVFAGAVGLGRDFGWTAYTPLTDRSLPPGLLEPETTAVTTALAILACAVGNYVLESRRKIPEPTP
ncbi:hypothetical protein FOS14_00665 [Skermania sp. ID1734]|uniref:hypothetical protein n=1 Tax=Skermania sp. ID1734 TaxID=2597516 RepID=UPI00117EF383|nr:hypothetical protein [Skermania sp. ID1734]TSE01940.1 hypothetical protein FOS14_00665 [Skermania sp. ID1734]